VYAKTVLKRLNKACLANSDSALGFQRPPNYTSADRIYPDLSPAKPLNLQGITPHFVVFFTLFAPSP
ncbi:MAG: hypothetical protein B7Y55_08525, partial [Polynucleobacter sp. 35-46-207]